MYPDSPWLVDPDGFGADDELEQAEDEGELRGDFAERLLRRFLRLCESPRTRARVLAMVRSSVSTEGGGARMYARLNRMLLHPLARAAGVHASATRWELVAGQLVGLAMMRYVLEVEPIASADSEELVAQFAPAIRAVLRGA